MAERHRDRGYKRDKSGARDVDCHSIFTQLLHPSPKSSSRHRVHLCTNQEARSVDASWSGRRDGLRSLSSLNSTHKVSLTNEHRSDTTKASCQERLDRLCRRRRRVRGRVHLLGRRIALCLHYASTFPATPIALTMVVCYRVRVLRAEARTSVGNGTGCAQGRDCAGAASGRL